MKKNHLIFLVGIALMFLKSNLFLIESTVFYIVTNLIGAALVLYSFSKTKQSIVPVIIYIVLNVINFITAIADQETVFLLGTLLLLVDVLTFIYPLFALSTYLKQIDTEDSTVKRSQQLIKISIILAIIASFLLLSGLLFTFTLTIIQVLTIIVMVLEVIILLPLLFKSFNTQPA